MSKNKSIVSPQIETFEPFTNNTDASRTNMSSKQLLQVVVTEDCETPYILNKNYKIMTENDSIFVKFAEDDGVVLYNNFGLLAYYYNNNKQFIFDYIPYSKKMVNNSMILKYKINKSIFKKGDILFDYTNQTIDEHIPRIGYRTNVMFSSFFGYCADDAMVISESFANRCSVDYSEKIFIPITQEIKYIKEGDHYFKNVGEISNDHYINFFKIDPSSTMISEAQNISSKHSKFFGKKVEGIKDGKITSLKVHKLTKKSFEELKQGYIYSPGMIEEIEKLYDYNNVIKNDIFKELSNYIMDKKELQNIVDKVVFNYITVTDFNKKFKEDLSADYKIDKDNIDLILEVEIIKKEPTHIGDKFANLYAGKGVVSLIVPDHLMPRDSNGDIADLIFNPLGLFGRNNWGSLFESALGKVIEDIENNITNKAQTLKRLKCVNNLFIKKIDTEYYEQVSNIIDNFDNYYEEFKAKVFENGFYLFAPNFPKITYNEFINEFILIYENKFKINISEKEDTCISLPLIQYLKDMGYTSKIIDSIAEDVHQKVYFGRNIYLKLFHTAYSKYNAIGLSTSYNKSTGQPARGRKKQGGTHSSWQSLACFLAYKSNNAVLKELYSIKADVGSNEKRNMLNKYILTGKYYLKNKYESKTKQTLNNNLLMIGTKFDT